MASYITHSETRDFTHFFPRGHRGINELGERVAWQRRMVLGNILGKLIRENFLSVSVDENVLLLLAIAYTHAFATWNEK